jgi:hypothetical protein
MRFKEIFLGAKQDINLELNQEATRVSNIDNQTATTAELDLALESIENIGALQRELISWIEAELESQVITTPADVDALCTKVDAKIEAIQDRFIEMYEKAPKEPDSINAWLRLLTVFDQIRASTRKDLLSELNKHAKPLHPTQDSAPEFLNTNEVNTPTTREHIRITELERDVEDALEMLEDTESERDEMLVRVRSLEEELRSLKKKLKETTEKPNDTVEFNFETRRTVLLQLDQELDQRESAIDTAYTDMVQFLQSLRRRKEYDITELIERTNAEVRLEIPDAQKKLVALQHEEKVLEKQIIEVERRLRIIEQSSDLVKHRRRAITRQLEAISLIQTPIETSLPDIHHALELANILPEDENENGDNVVTIPSFFEVSNTPRIESEYHRLTELPYTVEFTEHDLEVATEMEERITNMQNLSEEEIRRHLMYPLEKGGNSDDTTFKKELLDEMIREIKEGTYMDKVKLAVVLLGALRKGNAFSGRLGARVNSKLRMQDVELAKHMRDAAAIASRVFNKMEVMGDIDPTLRLITKVAIGNQHGKATELTPKGEIFSQVWTEELLQFGVITESQLSALHASVN